MYNYVLYISSICNWPTTRRNLRTESEKECFGSPDTFSNISINISVSFKEQLRDLHFKYSCLWINHIKWSKNIPFKKLKGQYYWSINWFIMAFVNGQIQDTCKCICTNWVKVWVISCFTSNFSYALRLFVSWYNIFFYNWTDKKSINFFIIWFRNYPYCITPLMTWNNQRAFVIDSWN